MITRYRRDWEGKEWQRFSKQLVQVRHHAQNVQDVPDKVQGDAGLEFITKDNCCYQSYAPEEASDVKKAASAMKAKGARDLRKLIKNQEKISEILGDRKISNWILLVPFLDNKDVISHIQKVAAEVTEANLSFLTSDFCALVQCQEDFETEFQQLRAKSVGPHTPIRNPSTEQLQQAENKLDQRVEEKLKRAFPLDSKAKAQSRKGGHLFAHVLRENVLSDLRDDFPDVWEASKECISSQERRLEMAGAEGETPRQQINSSMDRMERTLKSQAPGLSEKQISYISQGQVGTWLIECPLDFDNPSEK